MLREQRTPMGRLASTTRERLAACASVHKPKPVRAPVNEFERSLQSAGVRWHGSLPTAGSVIKPFVYVPPKDKLSPQDVRFVRGAMLDAISEMHRRMGGLKAEPAAIVGTDPAEEPAAVKETAAAP